ncbi:MAG: ATP-binding protein [Phycisphaerales bacterium]
MEKTKAPPPPPMRYPPIAAAAPGERFAVVGGKIDSPQRILIYGPGGIGKTSLAALAPNPVFLDIEGGSRELDVPRVEGIANFADLRTCIQSNALDRFQTIVIDSATKAEEMAVAHTLEHTKMADGGKVASIEGYGYGKGYQHVYDTFLHLLSDLDGQIKRGRHVVLIAHECVSDVPNPTGENFIRFEPHLQSPKSGKGSIRNRVVQWCDHVVFIGYDVAAKDGKGKGVGGRTIYTSELPDHVAKSRKVAIDQPFKSSTDGSLWAALLGGAS